MGGLTPPHEPLPGCIPPPKEGQTEQWSSSSTESFGATPKGNPLGGVSGVILPKMAPLILGLLGFGWGVFLVELLPIFTDLYRLSWEIILVISRSFIHS